MTPLDCNLTMTADQELAAAPRPPGRPKVSVMIITYNHGRYIAQAIESVLMQRTDFPVTINVIEDCSTDDTADIIRDYAARFPGRVIPYLNAKNIGFKVTQKNFVRGFRTLDGEYLAILEGDDYWTSPDKLQKQVDFLDQNPDYAICAHNTIKHYEDGSQEPHRFLYYGKKEDGTVDDAISLRLFFHTTGVLYRNVFKGVPPKQFISPWSCDIFILIAHAAHGRIHHMDEDMAVYRAHAGGRFSTMSEIDGWKFNIGGLQRYNAWLGFRFMRPFAHTIARLCDNILDQSGKNGHARLSPAERVKYLALRTTYRSLHRAAQAPRATRDRAQATIGHMRRRMALEQYRMPGPLRGGATGKRALLAAMDRLARLDAPRAVLPAIESFGPTSIYAGRPFNQQPDGASALWLQTTEPPPPGSKLVVGGTRLQTVVVDRIITATIPAALIAAPGQLPLWIEAGEGAAMRVSPPAYLKISPAADAPVLPAIEAFGPLEVTHGVPFNVQPDGRSALWLRLDRPAPPGLRIRFGPVALHPVIAGLIASVSVPPELTASPAQIPIRLEADIGGALATSSQIDLAIV